MGIEKLDCPICEAEFLKTGPNSKTCSRRCSHLLIKRQPRLPKYARRKESGAEITTPRGDNRGDYP